MSTITQVSSYSRYLSLVRNIGTSANNVDTLTEQLTTGKKSTDLAAFGPETQKLLQLRSELVQRENYIQNVDTALPRVQAADKVLTSLEKLASDWQSNNLMPFEPGPPRVSSVTNNNASGMKVSVNTDISTFTQNATYNVTAIPSETGPNGTFDVTVTDGLGGRTTQKININAVPPGDGKGWNFTIAGGPGEGSVLNLSFDPLSSAGSSSFDVAFPQAQDMQTRAEAAMRDIRQYMNERFGDRYLFAGSRYDTEPVADLTRARQTSKITLTGNITETDDYFEVKINDQTFSYQVQASDTKTISYVAQQLTAQINAVSPALPATVTTRNGIITVIGNTPEDKLDISTHVTNRATVDNTANQTTAVQTPTTALPQIDNVSFNGFGVDIGDTYTMEVAIGNPSDPYNIKYYADNPTEPHDLPIYTKYAVNYTVTAADYAAGTTSTTAVASKLVTALNSLSPAPPVTASLTAGTQPIVLTSTNTLSTDHPAQTTLFSSAISVSNGSIANQMTVATLPPENTPVANVPSVDPPKLPYYDSQYAYTGVNENTRAWDKSRAIIDDNQSMEYGVVSTDPAFQDLIEAFRKARSAAANPGKYKEYVAESLEMMAKAKDGLASIHAKVASDAATLQQKKDEHTELKNGVTDQIAKIEGIDQNDVAVRLSSSNNALQAAYTVASKRQQLSLLNYLA